MYSAHNDEYRECANTLIRTFLVRLFSPNVLGYSPRINVCVVPPSYVTTIGIKAEPHIGLFSEDSLERWTRIGKQVMCRSMYSYILRICNYARIHSQHFQICGINKYWRTPYIKVSSRDYSSIYARMLTDIRVRLIPGNWCT